MSKYLLILCIFLTPHAHALQTVVIQGLSQGSNSATSNSNAIQAAFNTYANSSYTGDLTLKFPAGTFYVAKTIEHTESSNKNRKLYIHIPSGTKLIATSALKQGSIFNIEHSNNYSFSKGTVCVFGGSSCTSSSTSRGGIIDTTNANRILNNNVNYRDYEGAISVGNFRNNIVQGLVITGNRINNYSNIQNRKNDGTSGIAVTGKNITIRFNTISNYGDAGIYVSGKLVNGTNITNLANIYNNEFRNLANAVGIKRVFKKALIRWNTFRYNTSDISATRVGNDGTPNDTAKPGLEIVAYGNNSRNVRGQFFLS